MDIANGSRLTSITMALALAGLFVSSTAGTPAAAPAPLVSASQATEETLTMSFAHPKSPKVLAGEQRLLFADVNNERAKRGLPALVVDETLNRFAFAKAFEMASRGYFGHTSPSGVTFQDRLKAWNWPTTYAGENIAFDHTEPDANTAFMGSAPHAANVLDPKEMRLGISVVTVNKGETFYVEVFSS